MRFVPNCASLEDRVLLSVLPQSMLHQSVEVGKSKPKPKSSPSFSVTVDSDSQVTLSWNKVSGATGYLVEVNNNQVAQVKPKVNSILLNTLSPNTTYDFDIVILKGRSKKWETEKPVTMPPPPLPIAPYIYHPADPNPYEVYNGTLYGPTGGPLYTDIHQGAVGDCWLESSLAEAALKDPQAIEHMFTTLGYYNENGIVVELWEVHFANTAGYVLVDNEFPTNAQGTPVYDQIYGGVLWVALLEKAYCEAAAFGYVINSFTGTYDYVPETYADINSGNPAWALTAITGYQAVTTSINTNDMDVEMITDGDLMVIGSDSTPGNSLIVPSHAYAVLSDNPGAQYQYTLFNPWNTPDVYYNDNGVTVFGNVFYANASFIEQNYATQSFV